MCMYLVNGNVLGKRLISYEVYESRTQGFIGLSEKQIINKLKQGEKIYGFKLAEGEDGEMLELDAEGFNMVNVQLKSGVNTLSFDKEIDCDINTELIVVATWIENGKRVYETVNARHARVTYSEDKLRMMIELGVPVAGVAVKKNKITVLDGVEDLDKKGDSVNE